MFSVRGLRVEVGHRVLISSLSFELESGSRIALVGPSGSGKSSLLRTLAALVDPAAGDLRLDGRSPSDWSYPGWRRRVVYSSQQPLLFGGTIRDNFARIAGYRSGRATQVDEHEWLGWLHELGLGDRSEAPAGQLSVGEQQRVALVRALAARPRVLLLDEPTSALDAELVGRVETWLERQVRRSAAAAIMVTHDRTQAERWCDRLFEWNGTEVTEVEQGG